MPWYYEEQGLLDARRTTGGHRVYDEGAPVVVRRLEGSRDSLARLLAPLT